MQLSYSDDDCTIVIQKNIDPSFCGIEVFLSEFIRPLLVAAGWEEAKVNALVVAEKYDTKKVN